MNKKNKRFIISSTLSLLLLFGSTIGIGYAIGNSTKKDGDYVRFYINNKVYTEKISSNESNLFKESNINSESKILMNEFYSAALFSNTQGTSEVGDYNYIFEQGNNWNVAPIISKEGSTYDIDKLKEKFLEMEFFNKTLNESVYKYLNDNFSQNPNIVKIIYKLESNHSNNVNEIKFFDLTKEEKDEIIAALSNIDSYNEDVLKNMYVYSYLWQNSLTTSYDYNLTRELVKARPSFVNKITFNAEKAKSNKIVYDEMISQNSPNMTDSTKWNNWYLALKEANALSDNSTYNNSINTSDNSYFKGLIGIQTGTSAGDVSMDWIDSSKTWDTESGSADKESFTIMNGENKNILKTSNLYLANGNGGSSGKGAIIADINKDDGDNTSWDDITGEVNTYSYTQLYPYMFKQKNEVGNGNYIMSPAKYSLFAKDDGSGKLEKADINTLDSEYIFDRWFNNDDEMAALGEIAIIQTIIESNPNLETEAFNYWKKQGFYIELSGSYARKYLSLIPTAILKDD